MQHTEFEFPKSYFENRKSIRFFFEAEGVDGFLFCVSNYLENNRSINDSILAEMKEKGKNIGIFELEWMAPIGPIAQFKNAVAKHPDGLILNNLDTLIDQTEGQVITTLNYAREPLLELSKPIMIWLTEPHYQKFMQWGADLYSRRSFSSLHFDDLNLSKPHGLMETRFSEQVLSTEEITKRKHRLQLLERQIQEAEESGYPKEKIANEMVFDLMEEYTQLQMVSPLKELLDKYEPYLSKLSFGKRQMLGNAYKALNQWEKAKETLAVLVKEAELTLGIDNTNTANFQNDLALVLQALGGETHLLSAKTLLEKALATGIHHFGENAPIVAIRQSNLATVLHDLGGETNLLTAKALLEKALATDLHHFGENAPTVAIRQSNLATVLRALGGQSHLLSAKALLEKALATDLHHFGENAPTVAIRQSNLATVLQDLGGETHLLSAKALLEKALATDIYHFGLNAPTVAVRQSNLATVLQDLGGEAHLLTAKALLEKALATDIHHFGENAPTVAIRQSSLATVHFNLNDLPQALALLEKAYATFKKTMGPNHGHTKTCLNSLEVVRKKIAEQS